MAHIMAFNLFLTTVALVGSLLFWTSESIDASAKSGPVKVFYPPYQEAAPVAVGQVQVIYYRPVLSAQRQSAAHVCIDRQFHTGLLPGAIHASAWRRVRARLALTC